jgi:hypothetical protein
MDGAHVRGLAGAGMVLLGVPKKPAPLPAFALIPSRRFTRNQERLDFSAARGITAGARPSWPQDVDRAYELMLKGDVRYPLRHRHGEPERDLIRSRMDCRRLGMHSPPRSRRWGARPQLKRASPRNLKVARGVRHSQQPAAHGVPAC